MDYCPALASLHEPLSTKSHYLLSGTFNSIFLYLLAFNPLTLTLTLSHKIPAQGPHQFLATNAQRDVVYATTWAKDATLSSWSVVAAGEGGVSHLNTVPITSTSSYIQLSTDGLRLYSAGGPTGEVHAVDPAALGRIGTKLQELLFVEEEKLATADKTRIALRYGSHGIDLSLPTKQAFVPHLGHNSIFIYSINEDGTLKQVADHLSFGDGSDGPRHVVPSPDGKYLYAVTEHTSFVDVYSIETTFLIHLQRVSIIPPDKSAARLAYRGDTLRFSRGSIHLFATTRGKTSATKGYVVVWRVDARTGLLYGDESEGASDVNDVVEPVYRYETRNSGGKANAIEIYPFAPTISQTGTRADWIVLTDDEEGYVSILEWDGGRIMEIAALQLPDGDGASHAIWLS